MVDLIEMTVDSIRVHMPTCQPVGILKEKSPERYLPLWLDINEANTFSLKLTWLQPARPTPTPILSA